MLPETTAESLLGDHREYTSARARVWLERIRAGLEYRQELRRIEDRVAEERGRRDQAIRSAVDAGASYREVARALGLSHSRIQQIVNEGRQLP